MSKTNVVEIQKQEKKPRALKPKIEPIIPTMIVDVWRLLKTSLQDGGQTYPDTTEDQPEVIQHALFAYLQAPFFRGVIAKAGKRPVGMILSDMRLRPFGRPSKYNFIYCFWVETAFRNSGIGMALFKEHCDRLKKEGIFHWEAHAHEHLFQALQKEAGIPVQPLLRVIGGRV